MTRPTPPRQVTRFTRSPAKSVTADPTRCAPSCACFTTVTVTRFTRATGERPRFLDDFLDDFRPDDFRADDFRPDLRDDFLAELRRDDFLAVERLRLEPRFRPELRLADARFRPDDFLAERFLVLFLRELFFRLDDFDDALRFAMVSSW